jgi:hypothetical protein
MIREAKNAFDGRIVLYIFDKERPCAFAFDDIEDAKKVLKILSIISGKPLKDHGENYWTVGSNTMNKVADLIEFPF